MRITGSLLAVLTLVLGILLFGGQRAAAASLCVAPGGAGGCYSTITAAVAAASPGSTVTVQDGTYAEMVTVTSGIGLVAAGSGAVINATGLAHGILIQGGNGATVSGLTVENAQLEGIAILGSKNVTITGNTVTGNDKSLKFNPKNPRATTCFGAASFEQDDCGEGIHLDGVTGSTLAHNTVDLNAGGILLTDETGVTSGNTIQANSVHDNKLDCGITLASHPSGVVPPKTKNGPPGFLPGYTIHDNVVNGNDVERNGGAGVGIFASVPGTAAFNNLVENNILKNNGNSGVSMHSHAPGQNLSGNKIINNIIGTNNLMGDPDAGDQSTTGILVMSAVIPVTQTVITGNIITGDKVGIWLTNIVNPAIAGNHTDAAIPVEELAPNSLPVASGPVTLPTGNAVTTATAAMPLVTTNSYGTSASFTVGWNSKSAGQGSVHFGPSCNALIYTATQDNSADGKAHSVTVTGDDLATGANVGIMPGATYYYEVQTVSPGGIVIDNNGGQCYAVTIPSSVS